jgi:hypothetical protein
VMESPEFILLRRIFFLSARLNLLKRIRFHLGRYGIAAWKFLTLSWLSFRDSLFKNPERTKSANAQSKVIRAREVIKDGDYSSHFSNFWARKA